MSVTVQPSIYVLNSTASAALSLSGNASITTPGLIQVDSSSGTAITESGNARVTASAIHEVGGYSATGNASVQGNGVLIYNAGSNYNGGSGSAFGGITLSGNGTVKLTAAASGPYAGLVLFQARDNTRAISLSGNAALGLGGGVVYAPAALLTLGGNAQLGNSKLPTSPLVVNELQLTGNGVNDLNSAGTGDSGTDVAGQLLAGNVAVYVDNAAGAFTDNELARIQDAVNAAEATVAPFGVDVTEVGDRSLATTVIAIGASSAAGSAADGVLGSESSGGITLVSGWDWYTGSDATAVAAGQYDFETIVLHEMGHALGLGHSSDSSSVMYATLGAGTAKRELAVADLNIPDTDAGPCALHAALPADAGISGRGASGSQGVILENPADISGTVLGNTVAGPGSSHGPGAATFFDSAILLGMAAGASAAGYSQTQPEEAGRLALQDAYFSSLPATDTFDRNGGEKVSAVSVHPGAASSNLFFAGLTDRALSDDALWNGFAPARGR